MCWTSQQQPVAMIATKDIPVYKIMKVFKGGIYNEIYSYYQSFRYELDSKYEGKLDNPHKYGYEARIPCYEINKGYHSYSSELTEITYPFKDFREIRVKDVRPVITLGTYCTGVVIQCAIPKGARYYLNENGEYVSNQIIIKNVLDNRQKMDIGSFS